MDEDIMGGNGYLGNYTQEPSYDRERQLYHRLIGQYQSLPKSTGVHSTTTVTDLWEQFNRAVQEIVGMGHTEFSQYMITPSLFGEWNGKKTISIDLLTMRVNSMLWEMSAKFFFQNPNELIGKNGSPPVIQQVNSQRQDQHQEQEITLTIQQKTDALDKIINENMSPEQLSAISKELERFKEEPKLWKNAQPLIQGVLGFGKDIASQVIAAVIAFYVTKSK